MQKMTLSCEKTAIARMISSWMPVPYPHSWRFYTHKMPRVRKTCLPRATFAGSGNLQENSARIERFARHSTITIATRSHDDILTEGDTECYCVYASLHVRNHGAKYQESRG